MKQLIAFHNDPKIKEKYIARILAHKEADQIIKGTYWRDGKGCAVGCTIHSSSHDSYETELGIPRQLARIEDGIFESLPNEDALNWPLNFLEAIPVGANLYPAYWHFMKWLIVDKKEGVLRFAKTKNQRIAISNAGNIYSRLLAGEIPTYDEYIDIRRIAADAYTAGAAGAACAAAAAGAYAADADAYAACAAAACADAACAYAAGAYADAYAAARSKICIRQSEKLLEFLREAPIINN